MTAEAYHRDPVAILGAAPTRSTRRVILALFFVSGACGLVYEVVWMRMLTLVFGATAFATSTVLASFFTGLALGSLLFGRIVDRGGSPLKLYAALEAGIGAFAFLMPLLLGGLNVLFVAISRHFDPSFLEISLVRFVLSFAVLLVPATLMGGSLPVLTKLFAKDPATLGSEVGRLYFLNTFGAVFGAFTTGFVLILALGVREAAYLAGILNLAVAAVAFLLPRPGTTTAEQELEAERIAADSPFSPFPSASARLALAAVAISGFCALALEVLWTRSLVFFLDNSTHAFSTLLTAFLLGIALGSLLVSRIADRGRRLLAWLGVLELLIGVFALLAIPILSHSTPVIEGLMDASLDAWLPWRWTAARFALVLSVMLVPTTLLGMTLPLATKIYTRDIRRVGSSLGSIYSANTFGGVLGSLLTGFVLIPALGVQAGIVLVSALSVLLGGTLLVLEPGTGRRGRVTAILATGAILLVGGGTLAGGSRMVLRSYYDRVEEAEVLSYTEGIGATVKVFADHYGDRLISVNGFPVAGTPLGLQDAQKLLAHLPIVATPVPNPRVNVIGFGAGGTSYGMTLHPVERIDCVELVPAVAASAGWFEEVNHGVMAHPLFNLILGDGRNYALVSDQTYDVISIDATSPKMAGNGALYALEFYRLLESRLSEDGVVAQWVPFHLLSDREMRMTVRTFLEVFPHSTLWLSPLRQHAILLGGRKPLRLSATHLEQRLGRPEVRADLASLKVLDIVDFLSLFVMGESALASYAEGEWIQSDNHPYLEFTPALAYFVADRYWAGNLVNLRDRMESVLPRLDMAAMDSVEAQSLAERLERRFQARKYSIQGDLLLSLGEEDEAHLEFRTALLLDPDEKNWLNPVWRDVRLSRR